MISERQYAASDALALARGVSEGEWTAEELLETALRRIDRLNPRLNAVIAVYRDRAKRRLPGLLGPFAGVPFMMKDIGSSVAGTPTRRGSRLFGHHAEPRNAEHVDRLEAAGFNIVGRTSTCELGLGLTCESRLYGPTLNPWDPTMTTGGSSGGSAAAVAAGLVPAAHATDGFGSIRVPAACCGLVGLKPTRGRNTLAPGQGESMSGLAAEHVLTRSVRDSAAILDVTAGVGTGDPYAAPPPREPFLAQLGRDPGYLRIAFCTGRTLGLDVHDRQVEAVEVMADRLGRLGHTVEACDPPIDPLPVWGVFRTVMAVNVRCSLTAAAEDLRSVAGAVEPATWAAFEAGGRTSGEDFLRAVQRAQAIGRAMGQFHRRFDALLTPMLAQAPPPLGALNMETADVEDYWSRVFEFCPFAVWANLTGQPAMALPLGETWITSGPPRSVQLMAGFGDEAVLFRLAGQIEAEHPWSHLLPPDCFGADRFPSL